MNPFRAWRDYLDRAADDASDRDPAEARASLTLLWALNAGLAVVLGWLLVEALA
jgi:hypothetical protein